MDAAPIRPRATAALLLAVLACIGSATGAEPVPADAATGAASPTDRQHWQQREAALRVAASHPNELWRLHGAEAAAAGQWRDAFRHFRNAAQYADKYSQHRISLLYWHGAGVARDPVLAYIWADLAAERGYPQFVALREKMWETLSPAEQARVRSDGPALHREFGDETAKPRLARAVSRAKRAITGSRVGNIGKLQVNAPGADGDALGGIGGADIATYLHENRWDPERYWAVEDALWKQGQVEVGPVQRTAPQDD